MTHPVASLPSVLAEIVERTRIDLRERRKSLPIHELRERLGPSERDFAAALAGASHPVDRVRLIAELKPRSPSAGPLRNADRIDDMLTLYEGRADAVSVLIDGPYFGGGLDLLRRARAAITRPILAKGFFLDEYQVLEAREAGADAVLLMAALLPAERIEALLVEARALGMEALVEAHDETELDAVCSTSARVVGVNARDLRSLTIDRRACAMLLEGIPAGLVRVAESGILEASHVRDLRGIVHAVLIGTAFMDASDPGARMGALGW